VIESAKASIQQSKEKLHQVESDYQRQLHTERNEIQGQADRLTEEVAKQGHRQGLMELKASQDSIVKDLATHTPGTVVQPGTVLLTLVPKEEDLLAEIWVSNKDIGFVRQGQAVKLKFTAFPFQKYGMIAGTVQYVSADAAENNGMGSSPTDPRKEGQQLAYRALVTLSSMRLETNGERYPLSVGMQAHAEIRLGDRTVLEYLLSPVRKAWHEAGRER
jgi:HlyD family secretion protein